MMKKNVPKWLWDVGIIYKAKIMSRMTHGSHNCTGYEEVTVQKLAISEWLDFKFYDLVWWLDHPTKPNVMDPQCYLACWLGVSHQVGSDLCYRLITDTGKLIPKSSVKHVICDDYLNKDKKKQIKDFNRKHDDLLNDQNFALDRDGEFDSMYLEDIENDPVFNPSDTYPGIEPMAEDGECLLEC